MILHLLIPKYIFYSILQLNMKKIPSSLLNPNPAKIAGTRALLSRTCRICTASSWPAWTCSPSSSSRTLRPRSWTGSGNHSVISSYSYLSLGITYHRKGLYHRPTGRPRSYRKYILQIKQPSKYRYTHLQYRSAAISEAPSNNTLYIIGQGILDIQ